MDEPSVQDWLRLVLAQANGCAYEQAENAEQDAAGNCFIEEICLPAGAMNISQSVASGSL